MLYLALEDDFQRIQSRMFMMYGVEDSEKLYFATAANKVGQGLNDQLSLIHISLLGISSLNTEEGALTEGHAAEHANAALYLTRVLDDGLVISLLCRSNTEC